MIDVETRARRAGDAARAEASERVHGLEAPVRRADRVRGRHVARPLAGALAGAVVVLLVVLLVGQLAQPGTPTIEPAGPDLGAVSEPVAVDGVLPVPPVGEAIPAYLEDGTPVFVSHPEAGDVRVLGALNPHIHGWRGKLVAYCPSSGWFEDLIHGSRWNAWGDWVGGPAPSALPDHEVVTSADGETVRVTGEVDHARPRTDVRAEQPQRGPNCVDGSDEIQGAMAHEAPDEFPALDGGQIPTDRWAWAEVQLGGAPSDPRACDHDGTCRADAPRLVTTPGWDHPVPEGVHLGLVRRTPEGVIVLSPGIVPPEWPRAAGETGPVAGTSPPLLPLPGLGEAIPAWLDDRTPVFVAREDDGNAHVLDATSQHRERNLVGWCPSSGSFVDIHGARWSISGGYIGGTARGDLRRYPAEIVEHGETAAVRVTGRLGPELQRSEPVRESGPWCGTDGLVRHMPGERTTVWEEAPQGGRADGWWWVDMAIAEVDGQLRLCVVNGPEACGEPDLDHDPTNAYCWDDIGTEGLCPPAEDPVVTTDGAVPTDGPVLMLVRTSADGREVEVRYPAEFDGA